MQYITWRGRTLRLPAQLIPPVALASVWLAACAALAAEPVPARLERLAPSPSLLLAPEGVRGEYTIAQTAPAVDFAIFPGQDAAGPQWSTWGESLTAASGKFYASIGNNAVPSGKAYVYEVDPAKQSVTRVVDFASSVNVFTGHYVSGKIHCPLVQTPDGWIYFFGFRSFLEATTREHYFRGDWLLRHRPDTGKTENLGIPIADSSIAALAYEPVTHSLVGLTSPGRSMAEPRDLFFRYHLDSQELVFHQPVESRMVRVLIVAGGRAYYGHDGENRPGTLMRYDAQTNKTTDTLMRIPGDGLLRAVSNPNAEGVIYCMSRSGVIFAFDPQTEKATGLGEAFPGGPHYVVCCRLDPSGRYLYYTLGADGGSSRFGTPIVQFDVQTGKRKVLAFLNDALRRQKNYNLGGTFGIALSADGSQLFVNWNGNSPTAEDPEMGLCSAMILHIPASERTPGR